MNATVKDVMTTEVVVVRRGATFKETALALRRFRVSALPVVDADGKVIGVVSEADMLAKEVPLGLIDGLQDGVVTVTGSPETAALGHHIVGKVRQVQGVVAVHDTLSYPDVYPIVAGPVL